MAPYSNWLFACEQGTLRCLDSAIAGSHEATQHAAAAPCTPPCDHEGIVRYDGVKLSLHRRLAAAGGGLRPEASTQPPSQGRRESLRDTRTRDSPQPSTGLKEAERADAAPTRCGADVAGQQGTMRIRSTSLRALQSHCSEEASPEPAAQIRASTQGDSEHDDWARASSDTTAEVGSATHRIVEGGRGEATGGSGEATGGSGEAAGGSGEAAGGSEAGRIASQRSAQKPLQWLRTRGILSYAGRRMAEQEAAEANPQRAALKELATKLQMDDGTVIIVIVNDGECHSQSGFTGSSGESTHRCAA